MSASAKAREFGAPCQTVELSVKSSLCTPIQLVMPSTYHQRNTNTRIFQLTQGVLYVRRDLRQHANLIAESASCRCLMLVKARHLRVLSHHYRLCSIVHFGLELRIAACDAYREDENLETSRPVSKYSKDDFWLLQEALSGHQSTRTSKSQTRPVFVPSRCQSTH